MKDYIQKLTARPKIIAVIAETNQGKSNLLYTIITEMQAMDSNCTIHTYGLRNDVGTLTINSLGELEAIRNSVVVIDEFLTLFDVDDRKSKKAIENSLRLINHNNNILIICGLPDNFKKFLSNKVDIFIFKRCRLGSFINGSYAKMVCLNYRGMELGAATLDLKANEALLFDGNYTKVIIPYLEQYDTKKKNTKIVKICATPVEKPVPRKVSLKSSQ